MSVRLIHTGNASFARAAALIARDIKLAHSVFALPFAVLAAFLAEPAFRTPPPDALRASWKPFAGKLALVVVCMVFARTFAMVVNRLADRAIDAANPRTNQRVFASGRLSRRAGGAVLIVTSVGFVLAAGLFWAFDGNVWPIALSPLVLAWLALYSFTKRFTAWCHLFLGGALAAAPLAAAIAVDPSSIPHTPTVWYLAGFVLAWVAGFDIIYALQDMHVDRAAGLHSVPSALGVGGAVLGSRVLHLAALSMLVLAWKVEPRFGPIFCVAIILVACVLIWEHLLIARLTRDHLRAALSNQQSDTPPPTLTMAVFTLNGVIGCALALAGIADIGW